MFKGLDKFSSKIVRNMQFYERLEMALDDFRDERLKMELDDFRETYEIIDFDFSISIGCGKKGCSISFYIYSNSIDNIEHFCEDFTYFLGNSSVYEDLVNVPFVLRELSQHNFSKFSYCASFWYLDPFETEPNAPDLEGGEG